MKILAAQCTPILKRLPPCCGKGYIGRCHFVDRKKYEEGTTKRENVKDKGRKKTD
jgi:hypothetical protein